MQTADWCLGTRVHDSCPPLWLVNICLPGSRKIMSSHTAVSDCVAWRGWVLGAVDSVEWGDGVTGSGASGQSKLFLALLLTFGEFMEYS